MKFLKYFLIWLGVVMMLACVAGYVYVRVNGKRIFEKELTKFFGQPTTIEEARYLVPAGIRFRKLVIRNVLEADDVQLHLRFPFLLDKQFIIAQLQLGHPVFHVVRPSRGKIDFGGTYLRDQEERFHPKEGKNHARVSGILVDFLSIRDGSAEVLDLSGPKPVKYTVDHLNGKARKITFPLKDQNIKFDMQGRILGSGTAIWLRGGSVRAEGWVNWPVRAMDVNVNLKAPSGITLNVAMIAQNNIVHAKGRAELGSAPKKEGAAGSVKEVFPDLVLGALQASNSKLGMNFSFQTKMDDFQLKLVDFHGELDPLKEKSPLDFLNLMSLFGTSTKEEKAQPTK